MILLIAVLGAMSISSISRLRDISTVLSDQDLLLTRTASNIQFGLTLGRINRLIYTDRGDAQAYQVALETMQKAQGDDHRTPREDRGFQVRGDPRPHPPGHRQLADDASAPAPAGRGPAANALPPPIQEAVQKVEGDLDDLGPGPERRPRRRGRGPGRRRRGPRRRCGNRLADLRDLLIRATVNLRALHDQGRRGASEAEKNLAEALPRSTLRDRSPARQACGKRSPDAATSRLREWSRRSRTSTCPGPEANTQMPTPRLHDTRPAAPRPTRGRAKALATTSMWSIIALTLVLVLLGAGVATVLPLAIARNLAELVRVAHRVGQGDLTVDSAVQTHDELGQLARSLAAMRANLHRLIERIQRTSLSLVTATNEILASSEQQARTSTSQSSSVNEISATVNELNATASELSRNTRVVAERANDCADISQRADQTVREALDGMQRITMANSTAAQRFTALAEKIEAIEAVLASVSQIAERTELLSLNASIEAAKAGEQGKGFAVVAGEIRRLADRTGEASQQVGRLVAEVRAATDASVMSMEQSSQEIRNGAALMGGVGQNMHSIDGAVREILQQMDGIRIASEQLAAATAQVSIAVASIQDGATQVSTGARQAASGAYSLNTTAGELRETVSEFRLIRR
jgi:methyl-accepting chemotaxis protein